MGSRLRLVAGVDRLDEAWSIVSPVFAGAESDLTRFAPESPLSRLNRGIASGQLQPVPRRLALALVTAHRAYRITAGRFDPRIIGALEATGERAGVPLPASPTRLIAGERWLCLERRPSRAVLTAPVDLGGIGKGLALQWSRIALQRSGISDFLIEAGGDIVVSGHPPDAPEWQVTIDHPAGDGPAAVVRLSAGAIATSSASVRHWLGPDGRVQHHLIDPLTGSPAANGVQSITVAMPGPTWADVWATALFVGNRATSQAVQPAATWRIGSDGRLVLSHAARQMSTWLRSAPLRPDTAPSPRR